MPAEIEMRENGGAVTINADWETPWHGLGKVVDRLTIEELWLALPELAAEVHPRDIQTAAGFVIPDRVANFREPTTLLTEDGVTPIPEKYMGTVSRTYHAIQNRNAYSFVEAVQAEAEGQARVVSAGGLGDGRVTWIQTHLGADYLIPGDPLEQRDKYLLFANSFDASMAFSAIRTNVRVVCRNTLNAAIRQGRVYRVRHTRNAEERVQEARQVLGLAEVAADREAKAAEQMAATTIPDSVFEDLLERLFPTRTKDGEQKEGRGLALNANRQAAVGALYLNDPSIGDKRGTVWGAWNAVTAWDEHVRTQRPEVRMKSAVMVGNPTSERAFDLLTKGRRRGTALVGV